MSSVRFLKKAISFCIALLLVVGFCPCRAFAAEPVTISLEVENQITGDAPGETVPFTFVLEPKEDSEPVSESLTTTIHGEGTAAFENITFTNPGVYEYTIYERDDAQEGYTYDASVYHVEVDVEADAQGKLETTITSHKNSERMKARSFEFINEYNDAIAIEETETTPDTNPPAINPNDAGSSSTSSQDASLTSTTKNSSPRTGDRMDLNLWMSLVCISGIILVCTITFRLRNKKFRNL
jgi:pilin isopeptide linkage protein